MVKLIVSSIFTIVSATVAVASTYWLINYGPKWSAGEPYPYILFPVMAYAAVGISSFLLFGSAVEYDGKYNV